MISMRCGGRFLPFHAENWTLHNLECRTTSFTYCQHITRHKCTKHSKQKLSKNIKFYSFVCQCECVCSILWGINFHSSWNCFCEKQQFHTEPTIQRKKRTEFGTKKHVRIKLKMDLAYFFVSLPVLVFSTELVICSHFAYTQFGPSKFGLFPRSLLIWSTVKRRNGEDSMRIKKNDNNNTKKREKNV